MTNGADMEFEPPGSVETTDLDVAGQEDETVLLNSVAA